MKISLALVICILLNVQHCFSQSDPNGGSMPTQEIDHSHACLSDIQRENIKTRLKTNRKRLKEDGILQQPIKSITRFIWPIKNANGNDEYSSYGISNYVDHNSNFPNQLSDYQCQGRTYDLNNGYNHQGLDIYLWPFTWYKMENNHVAVIAASQGIILDKIDGFYDKNCSFNNDSWNAVYILHSDESTAWYGHLKSGSLTSKSIGEFVETGEFLGYIGSSGSSTAPHLHFEVYDADNHLIDPYSGPCNTLNGTSWWEDQKPYIDPHVNTLYVHSAPPDFKTCPEIEDVNRVDTLMYSTPYQFATYYNDQQLGDLSSFKILKPDGSIFREWTQNSPDTYYSSYWYWTWTIPNTQPSGDWTFTVDYNGATYSRSFHVMSIEDCDPVSDLTLSNITANSVDISWSSNNNADYYLIFWFDDMGNEIGGDETVESIYSISNLEAGQSYCILVYVICESNQSTAEEICFDTTTEPTGSYNWSYVKTSGDNSDSPDYLPIDIRDTFFAGERVYATVELTDVYLGCYLETEFYTPEGILLFTGESQVDNETGFVNWVRSYSYITPEMPGQYVIDVHVTPENGQRQLQQSKTFFVEETTYTESKSDQPINAYPNPFENQVILSNVGNAEIIISDIQGKRINISKSRNGNDIILDFSTQKVGIYLATILKNGEIHHVKLSTIR